MKHAQTLPIILPGINPETVQHAGLRHIDADTAWQLTGISATGMLIPYHTIEGATVTDNEQPFFRLRLDHPRDGQKYHQIAGSTTHAYIPPQHVGSDRFEEIILVEGEKKALALSDVGEIAFGISGFYGGATKTEGERWVPVPELEAIQRICPPSKIYFAGDQDTLFNGQFYDAAIKLKQAFPSATVHCLQVPADAPGKGFDDCRAALDPEAFFELRNKAKAKAERVQVDSRSTVGSLALTSLRAEWPEILAAFKNGTAEDQTVLRDNLVKLTASLKVFRCDLDADDLIKLAEKDCGYSRRSFNAAVKERHTKVQREMQSHADKGTCIEITKTDHQGDWAAQAAEVLGKMLYWHGKKFANVIDGKIVHFETANIATYLDHPDRCKFLRINRDGIEEPLTLTANDAEYIESVPVHSPELVRPIEVVSSMPALIWRPPGYEVVTGYDSESRVYSTGSLPELPSVKDARNRLLQVIGDFNFSNGYEKARCLSFLLTPAVVRSGALGKGRCPFFYISKDQKGAGGGYLVKLVAAVYGMRAGAVVPGENNAEKSKEGVSTYLAQGNHLIYFDNVRGDALKRVAYLESLLTEPTFEARAPYMQALVDVQREVFACTSNGATMSEDMADRTLEIRIVRQPQGYTFQDWPEGDLLDHVEANRAEILAAIYALVQCYDEAVRKTRSTRRSFRFGQWEHALSWLIREHFPELPGLLEDNYFDRKRVELTDPNYTMLVEILRHAATIKPNTPTATTELVELARERGVAMKGEKPEMELGKLLTRHFPVNGRHVFAGSFSVTRTERTTVSSNGNPVRFYAVSFLAEASEGAKAGPQDTPTATASSRGPSQLPASFTESTPGGEKPTIQIGGIEPAKPVIHDRIMPGKTPATDMKAPPPHPVMPPPLTPRATPPPPPTMPPQAPEGWFKQPDASLPPPVRRPPPPPPPHLA